MPLFEYKCDNPVCSHTEENLETCIEHIEFLSKKARNCSICTVGVMMRQVSAIGWTPTKWGDTQRSGQI